MRELKGVRCDAAYEVGIALAQQAKAKGIGAGNRCHTVPVGDFAIGAERGELQPGITDTLNCEPIQPLKTNARRGLKFRRWNSDS